MQDVDTKVATLNELEDLKRSVEEQIRKLKRAEKVAKKHTREEILAMFHQWGYITPTGAKIWRLRDLDHEGAYGMEVGGFDHTCHVDSTEFKVLLVVDGDFHDVVSYDDMWFGELLVV
jgi:hypothetical protein